MLLNIISLWKEYPIPLSFSSKLFFIGQLAYWLHCYPELYFQRVKKEDIPPRIVQATIGFLSILAAYIFKYDIIFIYDILYNVFIIQCLLIILFFNICLFK